MATQAKRDYYEILGVSRTTSQQEIKTAFEKLELEIRGSGGLTALDRLLEARRAYVVLSDASQHGHYDRLGGAGLDEKSAKRDYYEVLGVPRTATEQEIRNSFESLVAKIREAGGLTAIDKLLEVRRANAVLSDPLKRARYDQFGHAGVEESPMRDFFDGPWRPEEEQTWSKFAADLALGAILDTLD